MSRMFEPGAPLSPSGWVVMADNGRAASIDYAARPKGRCTWCGVAVKSPRRHWCSDACTQEFWSRDPNTIRSRVLKRDKGKPCPLCGAERFFGEVDHTIPIIEGGHPFDQENLRTICTPCHKAETKALAARRADARKAARETDDPGPLFGGEA